MSASARAKWKYAEAAKAFNARRGYARYTMTPNTALEAEMMDINLRPAWRILAAVRRFSWGNLSDFAVDAMPKIEASDPEPRPLTQQARWPASSICRRRRFRRILRG